MRFHSEIIDLRMAYFDSCEWCQYATSSVMNVLPSVKRTRTLDNWFIAFLLVTDFGLVRTMYVSQNPTHKSCCMPLGHLHMVCVCSFDFFQKSGRFSADHSCEANLLLFKTVVAGDSWGQIAVPVIQENPGTLVIFIGSLVTLVFGVLNVAWQQLVLLAGFCTSSY